MNKARLKIGDRPRHTNSIVRQTFSICERIYYILEYEIGFRIMSEERLFVHIDYHDKLENTTYSHPHEFGKAMSKHMKDSEQCEDYEYKFFGTENY